MIKILTSSKELTGLIKNVDTAFHLQQAGSGKSMPSSLYGYIPLIREQLQVDSSISLSPCFHFSNVVLRLNN